MECYLLGYFPSTVMYFNFHSYGNPLALGKCIIFFAQFDNEDDSSGGCNYKLGLVTIMSQTGFFDLVGLCWLKLNLVENVI